MFTKRASRTTTLLRRAGSWTESLGRRSSFLSSRSPSFSRPHQTSSFRLVQLRFWSSHPIYSTSSDETSSQTIPEPGSVEREKYPGTPELLSLRSASADVVNGGITEQRQFLIDALAQNVTRNVMNVIQTINNQRTRPPDNRTEGHDGNGRSRIRDSVMDRWTTTLSRERQWHRRRNVRENDDKKPFRKMTIDEIWLDALQGWNGCSPSRLEAAESYSADDLVQSSAVKGISPLFHFSMDADGRLLEGYATDNGEAASVGANVAFTDEIVDADAGDQVAITESALKGQYSKNQLDAVLQALALFGTVREDEWRLIGDPRDHAPDNRPSGSAHDAPSCHGNQGEGASGSLTFKDDRIPENEYDYVQELFDFARDNRFMLATHDCNLILASILSNYELSEGKILARSLQLFNEMNKVRSTGLDWGGPDSTTYRLLLLALTRRLTAIGEAAQICKGMVTSNIELNPETVRDAMRVCRSYSDLETASTLMEKLLTPENEMFPGLWPCAVYIEILMDKNMMKEAISFYETVKDLNFLPKDKEDELLFKLSHWPKRSRHGDKIDCTSVLLHVMTSLFEATNEGRSPRHQLWYLLLDRLADASGLDPSLEINVNMTIRRMLDTYPEAWPGHNLMRIGLRSAEVTKDAALMAQLIDRDLSRNREAMQRSRDGKSRRASSVPQVVFRKALNIALQNNDIQSMVSIFASFSEVAQEYPPNAVSECFGFMVRGYARTGRTEKSKELLMLMVEKGLETSDELFGDVLQSLVGGGKPDDAYDIFNQMNDPQGKLPVPGVSSYNAIIASHVHARAWDKAISTFNQMREIGITPGAQSIQGYLLAQLGRHGSTVVGVVIEDLLRDKMSMDEGIFLFISRILLPGLGGGTTDEIRRKARDMGESQPRFRELCLKIVMTARTGEVRDKKAKARLVSESDDSKQQGESLSSHSWSEAVSSVLELKRAVEAAGTS